MPALNKDELLARVIEAASLSGARTFLRNAAHPFSVSLWTDEQTVNLKVHIWNLTSGGPAAVRPRDEFRIQLTGVGNALTVDPGLRNLLLGWSEDVGVFAAFDASRHSTFGASPSIQVSMTTLLQASEHGISFHTRNNQEVAICFSPDQLANYVFNLYDLHRVGEVPQWAEVLAQITEEDIPEVEGYEQIPEERREIIEQIHRWVRERGFRSRVLAAYRDRCAVCHMQLRLVEAAHIVPVKIPGSSDLTSNGISLCPSHHTAYDKGLVGIAPNYSVLVNQDKLDSLRQSGLHTGEEMILNHVGNTILVPNQIADRPTSENLRKGLEIRGWEEYAF